MKTWALWLGLSVLAACADSKEPTDGASGGGTGGSSGSSGKGGTRDGGSGSEPSFSECADTRAGAQRGGRGSNIVWVVDSSGSMDEEAAFVQQNLNRFVDSVSNAGLSDYRVVLMTEGNFVRVPAPLGTDAAHFLRIDEEVGSEEPLSDLLARFDDYGDFLLPGVVTHFVVVTDDESEVAATRFISDMQTRLSSEFRVHAIASPPGDMPPPKPSIPIFGDDDDDDDSGCVGSFGAAAAAGVEHWEAARLTMGRTFSICSEDWSALFGELATEVSSSAAVPCTVQLPAPPPNQNLDFDLINVVFAAGNSGDEVALPRVTGASACGSKRAWYYDDADAPSAIVLCPSSCSAAEAGGQLEIAVGCGTFVQ